MEVVPLQDLNVGKKKISKTFNPWWEFHPALAFGTWNIGDLLWLVKTSYGSSRTPSCGILLNTTHGIRKNSQGGGNNVGADHAKS